MANYKKDSEEYKKKQKKITVVNNSSDTKKTSSSDTSSKSSEKTKTSEKQTGSDTQRKITVYGSQAEYNAANKADIDAGRLRPMNTVVHAFAYDKDNPESVAKAEKEGEAATDSWRISQGMKPHSAKYWSDYSEKKHGVDYSGYDPALIAKYDLDRKQQEAANLAPFLKASAQAVTAAGAEQAQKQAAAQRQTVSQNPVSSAAMSNFRQLDNAQTQTATTPTSTDRMITSRDQAEAQGLAALAAKQSTTPAQSALNAAQAQQNARVYAPSTAMQTKSSIGQMIAGTSGKQPAQSAPSTEFLSPALKSRIQIGENIAKQTVALDKGLMEDDSYLASLVNTFRSAPSAALTGGAQMISDLLGGEKALGGVEDASAVRQRAQEQLQSSLKGKNELEQTLMQGVYSLVENVSIMLFSPVKGAVLPLMGASAASDAYSTYKAIGVPTGEAVTRAATEGVISGFIEGIGGIGAGGAISKLADRTLASSLSKMLGKDVSGALASLSTKLIPSVLANAGSEAFEEVAEYPLQAAVAYLYNYAFGNTAGDVPASWQEALAEVKRNASAAAVAGALFGGANFAQNRASTPASTPAQTEESPASPTVGTTTEISAAPTTDGQAAGLPYNAFSTTDTSSYTPNEETLSAGVQAAEKQTYTVVLDDAAGEYWRKYDSKEKAEQVVEDLLDSGYEARVIENGTDVLNPAAQRIDEAFANGLPEGEPSFGSATVGAAERNPKSYSALANEYGTLPEGENPARTVDVPAQTSDDEKVSRFTRTMMEAQITPDEYIDKFEKLVESGVFSYQSESDKAALDKAAQIAAAEPFGNSVAAWNRSFSTNQNLNKDTLALGQLVYATAIQNGDAQTAMKTAAQLAASYTEAGRSVQSAKMLKKITADTTSEFKKGIETYYYVQIAQRLSNRFKTQITANEALIQNLLNAKNEADIKTAKQAIEKDIASQIPSDFMAKWTAWRYMSMLGNLKTFERNTLGNVIMAPVRGMKEIVKAAIERTPGIANRGVTKQTTVATPSKEQYDFARKDFDSLQEEIVSGGKYDDELDSIVQQRTIFQWAPMEALRRGIDWMMNNKYFGDVAFAKAAFVRTEARYLKAQDIDPNTATPSQLNKAREYAVSEAQRATYRDYSKVAAAIQKFSKTNTATELLVQGVLPFKKTPINVLSTGVRYSPVGLVNSITFDAYKVKNGTMTADAMVDDLASGLTGTGIFALGYLLANMGLVSAGKGDDDKENAFSKLTGGQNYALKIGDGTYTIDWLTPVSIPLFSGAELWNALSGDASFESAGNLADAVISAISTTADPMIGLSMLSSLNKMLTRAAYGDGITSLFADAVKSYLLQAFPTVGGQLARTVAPNAQNAYFIDKTDNMPDAAQRILNQILVKTPGSQWAINQLGGGYQIPERINAWGEKETAPIGERFVENFFSPGYWQKSDNNVVNQGIEALYGKTGELSVLPSTLQKYYTVDGENIYFSTEEYEKAQEIAGKTSGQMLEDLFNSSAYRGLTDEQKADWVADIYDYAKKLAKKQTVGVEYDPTRIERYEETGLGANGQVQLYRILESESESATQDAQIAEAFGVDAYTARDYRRKATGKYYYELDDVGNDDEKTAAKAAMLGEYGFTEEDVLACYNAHAGSGQKKADYIADATYALEQQGYSEEDATNMAYTFYAVVKQLNGYKVE